MVDRIIDRELSAASSGARRAAFENGSGVDARRSGRLGAAEGCLSRPLPPVCVARLPLVPPHGDRARARRPATGRPISYLAPFRERGWAFGRAPVSAEADPGGEYIDALHGWSFMSEAYRQRPGLPRPDHGAGPVGHAQRTDRQQRVERHHPHDRPPTRSAGSGTAASWTCTRSAARGDRGDQRARLHRQQRRLPAGFARSQGPTSTRSRAVELRLARGAARRAPLPAGER